MKLRNLSKTVGPNKLHNGRWFRTLTESVLAPEVVAALADWISVTDKTRAVLIGGLAISFYVKPRSTQDVDFLFMSSTDIPAQVDGFKRTRRGAFQHNRTHVEIEIVTPESINISTALTKKVFVTSTAQQGTMVASPSGLVALKLQRLSPQDEADVVALVNSGQVNMRGWPLTSAQRKAYQILKQKAAAWKRQEDKQN